MIYYSNSSEFSLKTTLPRIILGFVESRNLSLGARESTVHSISKISLEKDYCTVLRKIRVKFNGTVLY